MYQPPRPTPWSALAALLRVMVSGTGDLLSLMPASAYRTKIGPLGWSRRQTVIVNDPELVRDVMTGRADLFPKSDLMVDALAPLIGDSIFVSTGDKWRRDRRMIDPAFTHMRVNRAFAAMVAAVDAYEGVLDRAAEAGEALSLDRAMSHLTADVICRTVFSTSLESEVARDVFDAFKRFERGSAHVEIRRLIFDPAFRKIPQPPDVLEACAAIRRLLGGFIDRHLAPDAAFDDIASAIIAARDPQTGEGFTREELIDQIGLMFLAGHETTASGLTWTLFILSQQPATVARMREEIALVAGEGPVELEHTKRLVFVRNVFREAIRLYPPLTFLPRVAMEDTRIGGCPIRRGALVMIAPWAIHRHGALWRNPHAFDPDRFSSEREGDQVPGAYLPFGAGPRICIGAAFATLEATLILARLVRRYDIAVERPERVRPVARLTARPAEQIMVRLTRR